MFDVSNNPELQLTELENQMLAPLLIFQKMKLLPKNRWNALVDRTVNVPIPVEEISNTIKQLPRTPDDADIIPVQLKRKKSMKNVHKQEFINPSKIIKAIQFFKRMNNPFNSALGVVEPF